MTETTTPLENEEAKQRARAELLAYRERIRAERDAKALRDRTVEEQIAERIRSERAEREHQEQKQAEWKRMWAVREKEVAAAEAAYQEQRRQAGSPTINTDTPGRLAARMLRKRLGDDFAAFAAHLHHVDWRQFKNELARVSVDERNEVLARQQAELTAQRLAEAATLPEPESEEELEILRRHGFAA